MDQSQHVAVLTQPKGPPLSYLVGAAAFVMSGVLEKGVIDRYVARYGPMFSLTLPTLGKAVMVCDPSQARAIMSSSPDDLISGRGNALLKFLYGDTSVFLIDGLAHNRLRKVMVPPFRNKNTLQVYQETIVEVANQTFDALPVGTPFVMLEALRHGMLDIILRIVFGVSDERTLAPFRKSMTELLDLSVTPELGLRFLAKRYGFMKRWRRLERALETSNGLIYQQIQQRRADPKTAEQDDILALLLRTQTEDGDYLSDREIRDQLVTMLIAGHETTATTLAWAMERLLTHPQALSQLMRSLDNNDDAYLDAVVQETLRQRPPIPFFSREVLRDGYQLGDWRLPKGTLLVVHLGYIHQCEQYFQQAERFMPERFLAGNDTRIPYMPFGGGLHSCIGNRFAELEVKLFLKVFFQRGEFALQQRLPVWQTRKAILNLPFNGLQLVLKRKVV